MAENYKQLYEQTNKMLAMYQDEIVPGLRKAIEDMEKTYVEVVRCKDCKHWHEETGFCAEHSCFDKENMDWNMFAEDDFCSCGERKDNGKNNQRNDL